MQSSSWLSADVPDVASARGSELTFKVGREADSEDVLREGFRPQDSLLRLPVPESEHVVRIPADRRQQLAVRTASREIAEVSLTTHDALLTMMSAATPT